MREAAIRNRDLGIRDHLNEKERRRGCGNEATASGRGGVPRVARATGVSRTTTTEGVKELRHEKSLPQAMIRRPGGGRKKRVAIARTRQRDIEDIGESSTRGDPEAPLWWCSKSVRKIAEESPAATPRRSYRAVARELAERGDSLPANRKPEAGGDPPDRDEPFRFINETTKAFPRGNRPVISVDPKTQETRGNCTNNGREYHPKGEAPEVNVSAFIDHETGKVSPYGSYDLSKNPGWGRVGISHAPAEFAVTGIRPWGEKRGKPAYPDATARYINADGGGRNGGRTRRWKTERQALANELTLAIQVSHFPPGTSKWNNIEPRLFSFSSKHWRGRPLIERATVVNLIGSTTPAAGLKIGAELDEPVDEKGIPVSAQELAQGHLRQDQFHGEWNYRMLPNIV